VLGGTGSDTGGSIRGPAAFCGLAGIKPTYGLISRRGILPLAFSLDHAGPLAWTVEDNAILLQAMAGHDPADPGSADVPIPAYRAGLRGDVKGLRLGVVRHFYEHDNAANAATREAIEAAVRTLEGMGCAVQEVTLSPLADWAACGMVIMLCEAYAIHEANLRRRFTDYGEMFRDRMALAGLISGADYVQALRRRRELIDEFDRAMVGLDLILTASAPTEAPPIDTVGKFATFERPSLTMPFNVTGCPAWRYAAAIPMGACRCHCSLLAGASTTRRYGAWRTPTSRRRHGASAARRCRRLPAGTRTTAIARIAVLLVTRGHMPAVIGLNG